MRPTELRFWMNFNRRGVCVCARCMQLCTSSIRNKNSQIEKKRNVEKKRLKETFKWIKKVYGSHLLSGGRLAVQMRASAIDDMTEIYPTGGGEAVAISAKGAHRTLAVLHVACHSGPIAARGKWIIVNWIRRTNSRTRSFNERFGEQTFNDVCIGNRVRTQRARAENTRKVRFAAFFKETRKINVHLCSPKSRSEENINLQAMCVCVCMGVREITFRQAGNLSTSWCERTYHNKKPKRRKC